MSRLPWWSTLTAEDILQLRDRTTRAMAAAFPSFSFADCEDIVQHAFVELFRRREEVSSADDGVYRFLLVAARHAALDRLKSPSAAPTAPLDEQEGSFPAGAAPDVVSERREENERIRKIFCEFGPLDRFILWRHVVEGQSVLAIARELDLNWHRVDNLLAQILREIRRRLRDRDS